MVLAGIQRCKPQNNPFRYIGRLCCRGTDKWCVINAEVTEVTETQRTQRKNSGVQCVSQNYGSWKHWVCSAKIEEFAGFSLAATSL